VGVDLFVAHLLWGVISFLGDTSFLIICIFVGVVWALLRALSGDVSWLLAVEAGSLLHKVTSFFKAHGVNIHGVWVMMGIVVIVSVCTSESIFQD